jgi:hypothetical protein
MKQTAVEYLVEQLNEIGFHTIVIQSIIDKAKAMEKEQIVDACENTIKSFELDKDKTGFFIMGGEGYYNETYNK